MSTKSERESRLSRVKAAIVSTEDFPKPGIVFRDFLPILSSPTLTRDLVLLLRDAVQPHLPSSSSSSSSSQPPIVVGLDSRGFLIGPLLAQELQCPFIPIRKKG